MEKDKCSFIKGGKEILRAVRNPEFGGLYTLEETNSPSNHVLMTRRITKPSANFSLQEWHNRLAHLNPVGIKTLERENLVIGLSTSTNEMPPCHDCLTAKAPRTRQEKESSRIPEEVGEIVSADIMGPIEPPCIGGGRYISCITDHYSGYTDIRLFTHKTATNVLQHFEEFFAFLSTQTGQRVKLFRSDNGLEYANEDLRRFMASKGTRHELTAPYHPEGNGRSERQNRTLGEAMRTILKQSNLGTEYWGHAAKFASYTQNRTLVSSVSGKTYFETFFDYTPDVSHLRAFGQNCFVNVEGHKSKLDDRALPGRLVGYSGDGPVYQVLLETGRIVTSRNVHFTNSGPTSNPALSPDTAALEETEVAPPLPAPRTITEVTQVAENTDHEEAVSPITVEESNIAPDDRLECEAQSIDNGDSPQLGQSTGDKDGENGDDNEEPAPLRRSTRTSRFEGSFKGLTSRMMSSDEPTYKEALSGPDSNKWKAAINEELASLEANEVFELVPRPSDRRIVSHKFVLKIKRDEKGSISRYKARLVARGYTQEYGIDYSETFSPVASINTILVMLALAASYGWEVHQMDFDTAYLNAPLTEEVYMEAPEELLRSRDKADYVVRLKKALYGLKQSGREWNTLLTSELQSKGWTASRYDSCLFYRKGQNQHSYLIVYVDDILVFGETQEEVMTIKAELKAIFPAKDQGKLRHVLGLEIERDYQKKIIQIQQKSLIEKYLSNQGLRDCYPVSTPLPAGYQPKANTNKATCEEIREYQVMIGELLYLSRCTRPDISTAVNIMSSMTANPSEEHTDGKAHLPVPERRNRPPTEIRRSFFRNTCVHGL